jgi:hypothetical protein
MNVMKKLFIAGIALLLAAASFADTITNVDDKLLRAFSNNFPRAEQISWQEFSNTYVVSFVEKGIRSRITYEKNGSIANIIRYYEAVHLPVQLRLAVTRDFPGKSVLGVVEVSATVGEYLNTVYFIKMETDSAYLTIKMDGDGNSEITEKLRKAL